MELDTVLEAARTPIVVPVMGVAVWGGARAIYDRKIQALWISPDRSIQHDLFQQRH